MTPPCEGRCYVLGVNANCSACLRRAFLAERSRRNALGIALHEALEALGVAEGRVVRLVGLVRKLLDGQESVETAVYVEARMFLDGVKEIS